LNRSKRIEREMYMYTMNPQCRECYEKGSRAVNLSTDVSDVRAMRAYSLFIDSSQCYEAMLRHCFTFAKRYL